MTFYETFGVLAYGFYIKNHRHHGSQPLKLTFGAFMPHERGLNFLCGLTVRGVCVFCSCTFSSNNATKNTTSNYNIGMISHRKGVFLVFFYSNTFFVRLKV